MFEKLLYYSVINKQPYDRSKQPQVPVARLPCCKNGMHRISIVSARQVTHTHTKTLTICILSKISCFIDQKWTIVPHYYYSILRCEQVQSSWSVREYILQSRSALLREKREVGNVCTSTALAPALLQVYSTDGLVIKVREIELLN